MIASFHDSRVRKDVRIAVKPGCFTVAWGADPVYSFDACGRFLLGVKGGRFWQRGLDHRVVEGKVGAAERREAPPDRAREALAAVYEDVLRLAADLERRRLTPVPEFADSPEAEAEACESLRRAAEMSPERLEADGARFLEIYGGPVPILPPDQIRSVYFRLAGGCPWNHCRFCTLYADRQYDPPDPERFREHAAAVREFLGPAARMRRTGFLGDADPLALPPDPFEECLDGLRESFDVMPAGLSGARARHWEMEHPSGLRGLYAFATAGSILRWPADRLAALAPAGVRRIVLGVETGCAELARHLARPDPLASIEPAVNRLKDAGIGVGVTVIAGVGGRAFAERHVEQTVAVLHGLPLDEADVIYLSPLVADPHGLYESWTRARGVEPLDDRETVAQMVRFHRDLAPSGAPGLPRVAPYDLRRFLY